MNKENKKQMKSLKEKEKSNVILSNSDNTILFYYKKEDVKEAVLEFENELNKSGQWGLNKDNALKKYNKIFGDFEK